MSSFTTSSENLRPISRFALCTLHKLEKLHYQLHMQALEGQLRPIDKAEGGGLMYDVLSGKTSLIHWCAQATACSITMV